MQLSTISALLLPNANVLPVAMQQLQKSVVLGSCCWF